MNKIFKFADDTKLEGKVSSPQERQTLQDDLNTLVEWSEKWQMKFNVDKCQVLHVGRNNSKAIYEIKGKDLEVVVEVKDLGVIVSDDMKVSKQCHKAAKKGNQVLGLIARTFSCKSSKIVNLLYKSLVRPHLDYCIQVRRPHLVKDIDILEKVQRRATRMAIECKGHSYEQRLAMMKLTTLETRRLRADLLEVFKIMRGMEGVREEVFFTRSAESRRGHELKLYKRRAKLDVGKYRFGNRVVNDWNSLPTSVVEADTINSFKGKLDTYLRNIRGMR